MIKVVNSPLFRESSSRYDEDSLPPIGLGYIATHLHNNGIDVEIIDAVAENITLQELIDRLSSARPQFIASNIFTTNYRLVQELVESIEFATHFIIGGLSTKDLYKEIINWKTDSQIDIVTGDGELITLDIVKNCVREIPFLELQKRRVFNVFSNSAYYVDNIDDVALNRTFFKNEPVIHPFGFNEANIIASRGCIFNCTFCAAARSLNSEYGIRERSAESLICELASIKELFPSVTSIRVLDDLFLKNGRHVEFATRVFSNFQFKWRSMAHVTTFNKVDNAKLVAMKDSGCDELFIGIESGSPKILRAINKTHQVNTIVRNLTGVMRAGINIKGYFIYGFPDESKEDMELTYELALQLKEMSLRYGVNFRTSVFQYRPYHGTAIFHDLESNGLITEALKIEPDHELSALIGRLQFNFHTVNHSLVDLSDVHNYIYRTTNLTSVETLSKINRHSKPSRKEAL
ncbi:MAG: B12-binding domain-containing radical SAM protein [Imperialibacter sp.]|uniref:B12-binding domain-containing radical SAM protein n=1 Tax=Imperialibacter sp. TaxID=2038411 RepID=UPI003A87C97B